MPKQVTVDNRTRFTDKEIQSIKLLSKKGKTPLEIAEKFNTSMQAIKRILSSSYKKRVNAQSNETNKARYASDPEYRERVKQRSKELMYIKYHSSPEVQKKKNEASKKYHKDKMKKDPTFKQREKKKAHEYYLKIKDDPEYKEYKREYNVEYRKRKKINKH